MSCFGFQARGGMAGDASDGGDERATVALPKAAVSAGISNGGMWVH